VVKEAQTFPEAKTSGKGDHEVVEGALGGPLSPELPGRARRGRQSTSDTAPTFR